MLPLDVLTKHFIGELLARNPFGAIATQLLKLSHQRKDRTSMLAGLCPDPRFTVTTVRVGCGVVGDSVPHPVARN